MTSEGPFTVCAALDHHPSYAPRVEAEGITSAGIGHASEAFPCLRACFESGKCLMPSSAPIRENLGRARGSLAADVSVLAKQPKRRTAVEHGPPSARDHLMRMARPAMSAGQLTGTLAELTDRPARIAASSSKRGRESA